MEAVFHEKQEGSLCAQHCLNTLLQGPYYSAVDLGMLAQQLDEEERQRMAEAGVESPEYLRFMQAGSSNMDDSGFFSVQVLSRALEVWTLELVPYRSRSHPSAERARADPCSQKAFICNFREHWFAVRKLGFQWFNLNSLLSEPELISDTYLALFLAQLEQEGYSIFVVNGLLPDCDADNLLKVTPAVQDRPPRLLSAQKSDGRPADEVEDEARPRRLVDIAGVTGSPLATSPEPTEDEEMRLVLEQSRAEFEGADPTLQRIMRETASQQEESDLELALALSRGEGSKSISAKQSRPNVEDEATERAIAMSLQAGESENPEQRSNAEEAPTAEEIRNRRRNFLDRFN